MAVPTLGVAALASLFVGWAIGGAMPLALAWVGSLALGAGYGLTALVQAV